MEMLQAGEGRESELLPPGAQSSEVIGPFSLGCFMSALRGSQWHPLYLVPAIWGERRMWQPSESWVRPSQSCNLLGTSLSLVSSSSRNIPHVLLCSSP